MTELITKAKIVNDGKILRVETTERKYVKVYEFEAKDLEEMQNCEFCQSSEKRN